MHFAIDVLGCMCLIVIIGATLAGIASWLSNRWADFLIWRQGRQIRKYERERDGWEQKG
jgi:hypothetical protein